MQRLAQASYAAEKYLSHFQPHTVILLARFIRFIAGAFVTVLVILALVDEDILLQSHVIDKCVISDPHPTPLSMSMSVLMLSQVPGVVVGSAGHCSRTVASSHSR